MASRTLGLRIDEHLQNRLLAAAEAQGRTPHWLIRQAVLSALEQLERGGGLRSTGEPVGVALVEGVAQQDGAPRSFEAFAEDVHPQGALRAAITAAYRRPETECVPPLIEAASLPPQVVEDSAHLARQLVEALRGKQRPGSVEALVQEYALSSAEGVALMCLAEALLRIPDRPTRDALIRDKISTGDWRAHLGQSPSLFVNAATWGLVVSGRLTGTNSEGGLSAALTRLISRGGEPLIRKGVDLAMRMMGEQFVAGETIAEALANSAAREARGFRYSYDMLGEAAVNARDADRYYAAYDEAIHAIGKASAGRGIFDGPGISVKLSALHPRYERAQRERVMDELLPRLSTLALLAHSYDIGVNIDAEETDRLELSFDLLEALCFDRALAGWDGLGFVVQAYQKRAPFVLDWIIDLARRSGHRLMVRLVKGAYWDSEIKRAQVDGLEGFPVFTRKIHTDTCYIACARKLLDAPDAVFPQFATHNALTLATVHVMAGESFHTEKYEFQCLHGMGESLYDEIVGAEDLHRPCRIYAPVGTYRTLLPYLVRRLLENGANTSFVHQIGDGSLAVEALIADPVEEARKLAPPGAPHPAIAMPRALFGAERQNSAGFDFSDEQELASLSAALLAEAERVWCAAPLVAGQTMERTPREVRNPADRRDLVGEVAEPSLADVAAALAQAAAAAPAWAATPPGERAACLKRAADRMEERLPSLFGLIVREAGRSFSDAFAELREAVDFLRYYAGQAERFSNATHRPLGPVVCISPWNFPLAIFTGQIAAALAAGNPVLAKPAEETPLIAMQAVRILHESGVPPEALQFLPGAGETGAALIKDARVCGVVFTGSTEVARLIQRRLAKRLGPDGAPVPLIAETGGQNAMIVDSSALPEQVIADVLSSAFDSAGQRCSALRVLCLQDDIAEHVLRELKGAMAELTVGNPDRLSTDVGPVITEAAQRTVEAHIQRMRERGRAVSATPLTAACNHGTFVAPTLIEIGGIEELTQEVFGPALHVVRYRREAVNALIDAVNAPGYALTFAVHTRIDETIGRLTERINAGNIYVNRNMIGAVVGVQPFGGHGLSGTGPKAGGPLYLSRLLAAHPGVTGLPPGQPPRASAIWQDWLRASGHGTIADRCAVFLETTLLGVSIELPGPVGERNTYRLEPHGAVLCAAATETGLFVQIAAALATGNRALVLPGGGLGLKFAPPPALAEMIALTRDAVSSRVSLALFEGADAALISFQTRLSEREGPIVPVYRVDPDAPAALPLERLLRERTISVNTTAAGGNASLMTIG